MDPQTRNAGLVAGVIVLLLFTCGLCFIILLNQPPRAATMTQPSGQAKMTDPDRYTTKYTPPPRPGDIERDGLVLRMDKTKGVNTDSGAEIVGEVINRRGVKLRYVQITFGLYAEDGALLGTAIANINGLEADGTWRFKAVSFTRRPFKSFKLDELSGF